MRTMEHKLWYQKVSYIGLRAGIHKMTDKLIKTNLILFY